MAIEHDLRAHQQTWDGFVQFMKYGTGSAAILLILMAIFLL